MRSIASSRSALSCSLGTLDVGLFELRDLRVGTPQLCRAEWNFHFWRYAGFVPALPARRFRTVEDAIVDSVRWMARKEYASSLRPSVERALRCSRVMSHFGSKSEPRTDLTPFETIGGAPASHERQASGRRTTCLERTCSRKTFVSITCCWVVASTMSTALRKYSGGIWRLRMIHSITSETGAFTALANAVSFPQIMHARIMTV